MPDGDWRASTTAVATTPPGVVQPYCFPEPSGPVVLYLVDTAVAEAGGWFAGNPDLTLEETVS